MSFSKNTQFKVSFRFSIIEMLTVVFIILLLMSLIAPLFVNLKMNARATLCKNQLKQMGVLITSYQTDHNGYLPNDTAVPYSVSGGNSYPGDIPKPSVGNNQFYSYWNGHLLPYFNVNLPDQYTRYAMVTKVGTTRFSANQLGGPPNLPPTDILKNGWIVIDDAYMKGGYQDFKSFICPEIHQGTYDVAASIKFGGIRVPRISQLCNGGVTSSSAFRDAKGYDYGMSGGVPTTYLANRTFFGLDNYWSGTNINSYRIDNIAEISQKAFLLEGGIADAFGDGSNGAMSHPYYSVGDVPYDGGDLSAGFDKNAPQHHKLSFVHDKYDEFWVMNSRPWDYYFPSYWMGRNNAMELAAKFNIQFAGKATMASGPNTSSGFFGFSIVSYVDPDNGKIFENFFKANPPGVALTTFVPFVDNPNDFKYLVGDMNVLFGDGSVLKKDQGWLFNNRRKIAMNSTE